jgi:hypothetical protein
MFLEDSTPKPAPGPAAGWAQALAATDGGADVDAATGTADVDMAQVQDDAGQGDDTGVGDITDTPGMVPNARCCLCKFVRLSASHAFL